MKENQQRLQEVKALNDLRKFLKSPDNETKKKKFQIRILQIVGFLILFLCFLFTVSLKEYPLILIGLAIISGISFSVATLTAISLEQWPILSKHLSLESIEQRLRELVIED